MKRPTWVEAAASDKTVADEAPVLSNALHEARGYDYLNPLVHNLACSLQIPFSLRIQ